MNRSKIVPVVTTLFVLLFASPAAAVPFSLNVGLKGGPNGSVSEQVPEEPGRDVPISGQFGIGWGVGPTVEFRAFKFVGLETGLYYSKDRGSGHTDISGTGISIDHTQTAKALHVPVLAKVAFPTPLLEPYAGLGLEFVSQQDNQLKFDPEPQRITYEAKNASYKLFQVTAGVAFKVGSFQIPIELRGGYNLDWESSSFDDRIDTSEIGSNKLLYEGAYTAHFGVFTGIQYNVDLGL